MPLRTRLMTPLLVQLFGADKAATWRIRNGLRFDYLVPAEYKSRAVMRADDRELMRV
jgi:hypothetical protein